MSTDNNPMILVELTELSYRYGNTICAVDRVNGTMYGKLSVGYRVISERATMEPQYRYASLEGEYVPMHPMYANTLPVKNPYGHASGQIHPDNSVFTNACNIRYFATS